MDPRNEAVLVYLGTERVAEPGTSGPRVKDGYSLATHPDLCERIEELNEAAGNPAELKYVCMKKALPILAVAMVAGCGSQASELQVHSDGRIGPLQIDVSTEAEVRSFAGKPFRVERDFRPGKKGQSGRTLEYRCGRACRTSYSINNATGKLSDYWTQSPRFVTERGTHVGMPAARAARLEGRKLVPGCGFPRYIHLRQGQKRTFVLAVWKGRIDSMGYLGPHSVYYDGLC